ncbi:MAG TPA: bacillithiol biosynthesis cysteine-adding enzyme BshC [Vicinamibacterales bacterium]|nr:bacillithiol biosynthesis cysteine-adding enzyme BshC [Vicinamibacterales bacterium]
MQPDTPPTSASSLRLPIDIRRLPWVRRLAADYAYDFARLAPFFSGNPADTAAWRAAAERVQAHPRDRERLVSLLAAQQDGRGAPPEAREAAAKLADPRAVAVITGQQAGLFGGPLYTLLKALTAVKVAARVAGDLGVPAVPVFWIEAEDHDWNEVSSCRVLDADMRPQTVTLGTPLGAGEGPVASVRLDPSIFAAFDILRSTLPATEFTDDLLDRLGRAYQPGVGMSEAFGRWMELLLGHLGLVVYDASDPDAKPAVAGLFARELEGAGASTRLAIETGRALVDRGYHAQVVPHDDNVSLFRLDGIRRTIHFRGEQFVVGDGDVVGRDTLIDEARREPHAFSPNVLLRPVVQDTLFPTICYVAGPNELAYLAQLKPIYERFQVPQPLFVPRATVTLLDSASARFLSRYNLPLESLQPDDEAALNRLLETQLPASVETALQEASACVQERMTRLVEAVPAIDPTLERTARSAMGRMQHDLHTLHDKIIHAAKRRDETLRRQYVRTRALAFPDSHPQERHVAFLYFVNRYGWALVDRLHDDLPIDMGTHWVLTV